MDTTLMGMHIVVVGNPVDGLEFIGPFNNGEEAIEWANHDPYIGNEWLVAPLQSQEEPEV